MRRTSTCVNSIKSKQAKFIFAHVCLCLSLVTSAACPSPYWRLARDQHFRLVRRLSCLCPSAWRKGAPAADSVKPSAGQPRYHPTEKRDILKEHKTTCFEYLQAPVTRTFVRSSGLAHTALTHTHQHLPRTKSYPRNFKHSH